METKTSAPLGIVLVIAFSKASNCLRAPEFSSWKTPRASPRTCAEFEQEPWEANSKDSQALPSLCHKVFATKMPPSRAGHHIRCGQGTCPPPLLLVGIGENPGKGATTHCATAFLKQLLWLDLALRSASGISYHISHSQAVFVHTQGQGGI